MTARNMENAWRAIGIAIFVVLMGSPQIAFAKHAKDTCKHLAIRQIALDSPGMSKSNAFFAILNVGKKPCRLIVRRVGISDKPTHASFSDVTPVEYVLLPLRDGRFAGANNVIGFNISNDAASGPTRNTSTLMFELADGRVFSADYKGFDTSPFPPFAHVIRFSGWPIFDGDQCMLAGNTPLSFVDNPEIDTQTPMLCG